ncbi:MAG: prepilin-type N-terminal cleavage/methylation domain-containing protein [Phycisphaeraceae bacterium]
MLRRALSAFTLIELLVVVGIIALLMAMLLPALAGARRAAASVACMSNTRQIAQAAMLYAFDHNDIWVGWHPDTDRKQLLHRYLGNGKSNADVAHNQVWHCPSNELPDEAAGYGFNTNLNWRRLTSFSNPSRTVALCDAGINDSRQPTLATHAFPPTAESFPGIGRPNPRHGSEADRRVSVAFADGHAESLPMTPPFYPGPPGEWTGDPDYETQLWGP